MIKAHDDPRDQAEALLGDLRAAQELKASCERFGLLGHQVAAYAEAATQRTRAASLEFLGEQFERVLATCCERSGNDDKHWKRNTARELAQSAAQDDLEAALRDLARLGSAVDRLAVHVRAGKGA